jgi:hypothetical protein
MTKQHALYFLAYYAKTYVSFRPLGNQPQLSQMHYTQALSLPIGQY